MKPMKANEDKLYITIYWYRIYYSAYMSVLLTIMKLYYMNVGNFQIGYRDGIAVFTFSVDCYCYICIRGFLRPSSKSVAYSSTLLRSVNIYYLVMKYALALILSCITLISYAQDLVTSENDPTVTTEYHDGKLWAYRHINDCIVGLTCYEYKDYGKHYQIRIQINNLSFQNVTFDPDEVTASLIDKNGDSIILEVYTNDEFQKKVNRSQSWAMALYGFSAGFNAGSAGYSTSYSTTNSSNGYAYTTVTTTYNPNAAYQANIAANAQIFALGKTMAEERAMKEQGYLKKTTIHPNEGIVGYMNIKRKKGDNLIVNIPLNGCVYSFEWNVNKKK